MPIVMQYICWYYVSRCDWYCKLLQDYKYILVAPGRKLKMENHMIIMIVILC